MAKLKVGVIGTGSIGNVHLSGYAECKEDVEIRALADINPTRLAEMGETYGVPAEHRYTDFEKMLAAEELDVVSVCTPNVYHYPAAKAAILKGCHTLIEKPVVLELAHAEELRRLAAEKGVKTMVAFSHRFIAMNIAAKKQLDAGLIGEPFMIRVRYAHGGPYPGWAQGDWFYKKELAGGGALLDMGIHGIDICQYFIGPIRSVSAQIRTLRKQIEVDDNAVMLLDFAPARCLGYIECGWTSGPGFAGIEIYGDKGTMILDLFEGPRVSRGVTNPDGSVETKVEKLEVPEGPSHWPAQMQNWVRFVLGRETITKIPGLEEGTSALAVALAATESSQTGRRIDL